jgi:hypothetical protein
MRLVASLCLAFTLQACNSIEDAALLRESGFLPLEMKVKAKCPETLSMTNVQLTLSCINKGGTYPCSEERASYLERGWSDFELSRIASDGYEKALVCAANAGDQFAFVQLKVWQNYPFKIGPGECFYNYGDSILRVWPHPICEVDGELKEFLDASAPPAKEVLLKDPGSLLPGRPVDSEEQVPEGCRRENVKYINYNPCGIPEIWLAEYASELGVTSSKAKEARIMYEAITGETVSSAIQRLGAVNRHVSTIRSMP